MTTKEIMGSRQYKEFFGAYEAEMVNNPADSWQESKNSVSIEEVYENEYSGDDEKLNAEFTLQWFSVVDGGLLESETGFEKSVYKNDQWVLFAKAVNTETEKVIDDHSYVNSFLVSEIGPCKEKLESLKAELLKKVA